MSVASSCKSEMRTALEGFVDTDCYGPVVARSHSGLLDCDVSVEALLSSHAQEKKMSRMLREANGVWELPGLGPDALQFFPHVF